MAKQKFYVVWDGAEDGVYTTWEACQQAVSGYPNAKYKSFKSEEEAEEAFEMGYEEWKKKEGAPSKVPSNSPNGGRLEDTESSAEQAIQHSSSQITEPGAAQVTTTHLPLGKGRGEVPGAINNSIAVDAACSGNPGMMEYRGVYLRTGKEIFHFGPIFGTNNIGEFLAIVHGLALLKQKGFHDMPIYSDSVNAQLWVRKKKCKTTLERNERTEELFRLIERAETWLHNNTWKNRIIKWPTDQWGEIPADFGRKH